MALGFEIAEFIKHNNAIQITVLPGETARVLHLGIEHAGSRIDKALIGKIPGRLLGMDRRDSGDK
ncbi:hypothetical protein CSQ91_23075 [Janthinobacterium sp. BJB301]|nr:hypothetical protein CSQ91_23075 [Janthinobacterium sp. BJB301]